jgi:hypothetical protein
MAVTVDGICQSRLGAGRLCDICLRAKPAGAAYRELTVDPDDLRHELRLLGMSDEEIQELMR